MTAVFPDDLVLTPVLRWPTTLPEASVRTVFGTPMADRVKRRRRAERPAISIIIVTHDGLVFTRLCLEHLLAADPWIDFEVIVVDNASTDGTPQYLADLFWRDERVRVELNGHNAGFAAATNQGVSLSHGSVIVLLNNDTIPLNGWLDRFCTHLRDGRIGLVGAVTNRAGNEADIEVPYSTYGQLRQFAESHARAQPGGHFDIRTATMFCVALRRDVWTDVGPLDERFEIGLFEDDDFSMRVRAAGLRVVCAEDVFVHHFGQASIGRLAVSGQYGLLFHANRERWEAKWGEKWLPYAKRVSPAYQALVERIRELVCAVTPPGATVLVVSKGDEQLVNLADRRGWHFPQGEDGRYAGHNPPDSEACIAELERLRLRGAAYLVIPETSRWWLEHYAQFAAHLDTHYAAINDERSPAAIVALSQRSSFQASAAGAQ
jgi:GT2 family glycosyltransferase